MTFDQHSDYSNNQNIPISDHNNMDDHSERNKSDNYSENFLNTLNSFTSSYSDFQRKIEEKKILIKELQLEIKVSKNKKESLEAELSRMPAPDSLEEQNESSENFSDNSDTPPSDSLEDSWQSDDQSEQQHYNISTDEAAKVATNDQVVTDVFESKNEVKTCSTIERYIESIKNSIDHKSDHSEAYLKPLNISCNLLGSQIKHIKLLENLIAVFDEQRILKAKEQEMHDIIDLLAEQFTS